MFFAKCRPVLLCAGKSSFVGLEFEVKGVEVGVLEVEHQDIGGAFAEPLGYKSLVFLRCKVPHFPVWYHEGEEPVELKHGNNFGL